MSRYTVEFPLWSHDLRVEVALVVPTGPWQMDGSGQGERDVTPARLQSVRRYLTQRGVEKRKIWLTMERNMKCGIGLCGHCQFGPLFLCKDGPVVDWATAGPLYLITEV